MSRSKISRTRLVLGSTVAGIAVAAAGSAVAGGQFETSDPAPRYSHAKALGLEPKASDFGPKTEAGFRFGSVEGSGSACLVFSTGSDVCKPTAEVDAGELWTINNDCSTTHGAMTIVGVAPTGATSVDVVGPFGGVAAVNDGSFTLETQTPAPDEVEPSRVRFVGGGGKTIADIPFPVTSAKLCPPVS